MVFNDSALDGLIALIKALFTQGYEYKHCIDHFGHFQEKRAKHTTWDGYGHEVTF